MVDSQFSVRNEHETRRKPFRSRSFSFGSARKAAGSKKFADANQLLTVARSFQQTSQNDCSKPKADKKSLCDIFTRNQTKNFLSRSAFKDREKRQTFLHGRNACRYVCNIIRFIGTLIIFVAFGLHLQYQWQMGNYSVEIIVLSTTAATSLAFVIVLYLFFGLKTFSRSIVHFWVSLAYGVVFMQKTHLRRLNKAIMICILLSTGLRCFCSLVERIFKLSIHRSQFLSQTEVCNLLAFSLTCFLLPARKSVDMWFEMTILAFLVMNIRMKSSVSIPHVALFGIISAISIVGNIGLPTNKYSFACFVLRILWDPLLDLYFNRLQPLTRWKCFFYLSRIFLYPFIIGLFITEFIFLGIALQAITIHPKYEWPIVLPFMTVSSIGWVAMHLTYFALHISFFVKIAKCKRLAKQEKYLDRSLLHVFSAEGVKSLSGICHGVASGCVFFTGLFGAICWRRKDGTYPAMFLMLLNIECLSLTLFSHLATHLKGTCYGYGIVASTSLPQSKPGLALPSSTVEVQTMSATRIMNTIQSFFRDQFIESLGCDCWSRGAKLSAGSVETKLALLFSKRTSSDGQPYDNYIIYFSGIADKDGSWILADGSKISLDRILKIWDDKPITGWTNQKSSRLIIISDSPNSAAWSAKVKKMHEPIIVQTCTYACDEMNKAKSPPEEGWAKRGDFTLLWTSFLKSLQSSNWNEEDTLESRTKDFVFEARAQGILAKYTYSNAFLISSLSPSSGDFSAHGCTLCCLPVVVLTSYISKTFFSVVSCSPLCRIWFYVKAKCFGKCSWDLGEGMILINL